MMQFTLPKAAADATDITSLAHPVDTCNPQDAAVRMFIFCTQIKKNTRAQGLSHYKMLQVSCAALHGIHIALARPSQAPCNEDCNQKGISCPILDLTTRSIRTTRRDVALRVSQPDFGSQTKDDWKDPRHNKQTLPDTNLSTTHDEPDRCLHQLCTPACISVVWTVSQPTESLPLSCSNRPCDPFCPAWHSHGLCAPTGQRREDHLCKENLPIEAILRREALSSIDLLISVAHCAAMPSPWR